MDNQLSCDGFFFEPEIECYRNQQYDQQNAPLPSPKGRQFFGIGSDAAVPHKERRGSVIAMPWTQPSPTGRQQNTKERRDSIATAQDVRRNSLLWFAADEPWSAEPALPNTNAPEPDQIFGPTNLNTANPPRRVSINGDDMFCGNEWNPSNGFQHNAQMNSQSQNAGMIQRPMSEWSQGPDKTKQIMPPVNQENVNFATAQNNFVSPQSDNFAPNSNFAPPQNNSNFAPPQNNNYAPPQNNSNFAPPRNNNNFASMQNNTFTRPQNNGYDSSQQNSLAFSQNTFTSNNNTYNSAQNTTASSHNALPPIQHNTDTATTTINNNQHNKNFAPPPIQSATKLAPQQRVPPGPAKPLPAPAARKSKGAKPRCRTNTKPQYWTPDEHEKFLAGLQKFGLQDGLGPGGAELMSLYMGSRSVLQIKSHAQKYWSDLAAGRVTCPR